MNFVVKLTCCIIFSLFLIVPPSEAKKLSLVEQVSTCSQITSNEARLSCFDKLTTNTGSVQQANQLSTQQIDAFAKEQVKLDKDEQAQELTSISATVATLSKTVHGQWKMTFENGQKWLQKDSTKLSLKVGQQVVISKGALGVIFLQKANSNKRIKVKRLK